MKSATEVQLRKTALVLTVVLLFQLVWSGGRLLLVANPEPILPAEGSLQVDEIRHGAAVIDEWSQGLAIRPLFWQGREAFVPDIAAAGTSEPEAPMRNSQIDEVVLHGVYSAGGTSGVIISHRDKRRRLRLDESIAGWTFTMLSGNSATFDSGGETRVLALQHASSVPAPKKAREPSSESDETNKQDDTGE